MWLLSEVSCPFPTSLNPRAWQVCKPWKGEDSREGPCPDRLPGRQPPPWSLEGCGMARWPAGSSAEWAVAVLREGPLRPRRWASIRGRRGGLDVGGWPCSPPLPCGQALFPAGRGATQVGPPPFAALEAVPVARDVSWGPPSLTSPGPSVGCHPGHRLTGPWGQPAGRPPQLRSHRLLGWRPADPARELPRAPQACRALLAHRRRVAHPSGSGPSALAPVSRMLLSVDVSRSREGRDVPPCRLGGFRERF